MPEASNFMSHAKKLKETQGKENPENNNDHFRPGPRPTFEEMHIREIDIDPPSIHGKNNYGMKRLVTDRIITDSTHHKKGEIKK
jgi:hypothetical protein